MTKLLKRDRDQFFFFELRVSLIMDRVISVPLSTSERLPHTGGSYTYIYVLYILYISPALTLSPI